MTYIDTCPPAVIYKIEKEDLRADDSSALFTWVEANSNRPCAYDALTAIAARLTPDSAPFVKNMFYNSVATYADALDPAQKDIIRAAYIRIPYKETLSFNYFLGLRETHIDLRQELQGKIEINWTFTSPRQGNAATWDYYLYLAALNEPNALDALAAKIAATKNGNDAYLLLESLSELPGKAVTDILKTHANDQRRVDGEDGPGLPISENVRLLLINRT